jgi:hypothetical protein
MKVSRTVERWSPLIVLAIVLLLWQAIVTLFRVPEFIFPSPWQIAQEFVAFRGALDAFTREELWCILRDLQAAQKFNVILVTHDLRESVFLADTVYVMSKSPGRFVQRREIDLPRPRDLEVTYTPHFTDIVHELRGHIGAVRKNG